MFRFLNIVFLTNWTPFFTRMARVIQQFLLSRVQLHSTQQKLLSIICILFSFHLYALPTDNEQPMQIKADATLFNYKSGTDTYEGNVKVNQGSTHLIADRLTTKKNAHHKLEEATAYGEKELAEYTTIPNKNDSILLAKAKIIRFYFLKSIVILENNVTVTQGENSFHGERIVYNIKDQTVTAPDTKNGQTTIIIDPKKLQL